MILKRAFTLLLKALLALFLAYCIVTTIRVWLGDPGQPSKFPEGSGWVLLWCSVSMSILRRWLGPIGGRAYDLVHEAVLLAVHLTAGLGMPSPGASAQPPHQEEGQ